MSTGKKGKANQKNKKKKTNNKTSKKKTVTTTKKKKPIRHTSSPRHAKGYEKAYPRKPTDTTDGAHN